MHNETFTGKIFYLLYLPIVKNESESRSRAWDGGLLIKEECRRTENYWNLSKKYPKYKKINLTKLEKGDHFGIHRLLRAMILIFVRFRLDYNHQNAKRTVFDSGHNNLWKKSPVKKEEVGHQVFLLNFLSLWEKAALETHSNLLILGLAFVKIHLSFLKTKC